MGSDQQNHNGRGKRTTGPMLRMVTPMLAPGATVVAQRFDLGTHSDWDEASVDAWHDASDLRTGDRVRLLQRPTRALDQAEVRNLDALGSLTSACAPVAHSRPGEVPGWVAYHCDDVELGSEVLGEGPMTITEAVALGQGLCAAVLSLRGAGRVLPPLSAETLVMRRGVFGIDVSLLGLGLAWPGTSAESAADVQAIAGLVFQALTTHMPVPGQVPRLAADRPELSAIGSLEPTLRRALGVEAPALDSVAALQEELAEVMRTHLRGRKSTSPGLPRPGSALLSMAELTAPPAVVDIPSPVLAERARAPAKRTRWIPLVALLLLGLGLGLGLLLGSQGDTSESAQVAEASYTPPALAAPPPTKAPAVVAPPIAARATEPAAAAPPASPAPAPVPEAAPVAVAIVTPPPTPAVMPAEPAPGVPAEPAPTPAPTSTIKVLLTSTPPGAQIQRNGDKLGTTPLTLSLGADDFPLELRVTRAGYNARTVRVKRPDGSEAKLDITLVTQRAAAAPPSQPRATRPASDEFIFER